LLFIELSTKWLGWGILTPSGQELRVVEVGKNTERGMRIARRVYSSSADVVQCYIEGQQKDKGSKLVSEVVGWLVR